MEGNWWARVTTAVWGCEWAGWGGKAHREYLSTFPEHPAQKTVTAVFCGALLNVFKIREKNNEKRGGKWS